jgi:Aerotolerance regulator N-terminal
MTLAHPWFLIGLLALAIPIILHLFELRRPQQVLFTNVDFIREVKLITAKQRRLQHLVVLLLRLGFLLFLVLLFCQPFIPAARQSDLGSSAINVVVDNSASMSVEASNGKPLLELAVQETERIGQALPASSQYRVWDESTPQTTVSAEKLAEQVNSLQTSAASNGTGLKLRRLLNMPVLVKQGTFVVSDFQKSDFQAQMIRAFRGAGEVYLLPVKSQAVANTYVDSVYLPEEFVRAGVELPLRVRLRNGGSKDAAAVRVKVLVGARQVAAYEASVAAGSSVENTVRIRLDGDVTQLCRVEIEEQPVAFDNVYFFTLRPAGRIRIVDVASGAVATQKLYPNEATFAYTLLRPGALSTTVLNQADMVLLQDNARLSQELRATLAQFVRQGGRLVIVPPTVAGARRDYEPLLAELGLTTVRWNTAAAGAQELALPDPQNPFFTEIFAEQTRQPDMPRATPLLSWGRSTTDVLKFRDGQPFLSGFRSGEGMVYLFASPLQPGSSTFTEHPLFVPVMYRLATLSKSSEQLPAYRLTERAVVLRQPLLDQPNAEPVYKLSNDSNSFVPAAQVRAGRLYLQLPAPMRQPGFYRLTLNGKLLTTLAFNPDKKESELAQYSAEELRQLTAGYPNVHVYEAGGERSAAAQLVEEQSGTPLWRYCLAAALLCLLGEVLVLRFGQRRTQPAVSAA